MHTKDHGILDKSRGNGIVGYAHNLTGHVNMDFAGDVTDCKSTSGWVFTFNDTPICWALKKQRLVSRSSMESELIVGSFASAEGIWLIRLGKDFKHNFTPIPIFTNNQSSIAFSNSDVNNNRTKHIDIHFHYTCNQTLTGTIKLKYIHLSENPANILTKLLSPHKHARLLSILGICHA